MGTLCSGSDRTKNEKAFEKLLYAMKCQENLVAQGVIMVPKAVSEFFACVRRKVYLCIRSLHLFFETSADTFAVAMKIAEKFISKVKMDDKYLACAASACFFISSKIFEESEYRPRPASIASLHREQRWKATDLVRMETKVLKTIAFSIPSTTYTKFLQLFLEVHQASISGDLPCLLRVGLTLAEGYLSSADSCLFQPAVFAFCVFEKLLRDRGYNVTKFPYMADMKKLCRIKDEEVSRCQQLVTRVQNSAPTSPKSKWLSLTSWQPRWRNRPSIEGESELPTIFEDCSPFSDSGKGEGNMTSSEHSSPDTQSRSH